jgi:hypothetical protein
MKKTGSQMDERCNPENEAQHGGDVT